MAHNSFDYLDAADARQALELLGVALEESGAPDDPDERTSAYLAALLAATQAHIQTRRRHAEVIGRVYHATFEHLTGRRPEHPTGQRLVLKHSPGRSG